MAEYFLDENLAGGRFTQILTAAGIDFVSSRMLGYQATPDHIWIPKVSTSGRIIVSGDKRIQYNKSERAALVSANARLITISIGKTATMEAKAHNLVNSNSAVDRMNKRIAAPWLVHLSLPSPMDFEKNKPGRLGHNKLA